MNLLMEAEAVLRALGSRADALGLETLTDHEQCVLLPWFARGVVGNGGFALFYDGDDRLADVARGFRALGFPEAAEACERVMWRLFPDGVEASGLKRRAALAGVDWREFDEEEDVVFEVDWDELRCAVGRYVQAHPQAFRRATRRDDRAEG